MLPRFRTDTRDAIDHTALSLGERVDRSTGVYGPFRQILGARGMIAERLDSHLFCVVADGKATDARGQTPEFRRGKKSKDLRIGGSWSARPRCRVATGHDWERGSAVGGESVRVIQVVGRLRWHRASQGQQLGD